MRDSYPIDNALLFAIEAHAGQVYKGYNGQEDQPYIIHVLRVAARVPVDAVVVALLHDCLEDAGRLPDWLAGDELEAVKLLSRDKKRVSYSQYIDAIASAPGEAGRLARLVKLSDLADNLSKAPSGSSLRARYEKAFKLLTMAAV